MGGGWAVFSRENNQEEGTRKSLWGEGVLKRWWWWLGGLGWGGQPVRKGGVT